MVTASVSEGHVDVAEIDEWSILFSLNHHWLVIHLICSLHNIGSRCTSLQNFLLFSHYMRLLLLPQSVHILIRRGSLRSKSCWFSWSPLLILFRYILKVFLRNHLKGILVIVEHGRWYHLLSSWYTRVHSLSGIDSEVKFGRIVIFIIIFNSIL